MEGRAVQPRRGPGLKMLVDLCNKILDQLLLGRHGLNQPLELGGRDGGFSRSGSDGSRGDRSRSGGDSCIDRGTRRRLRLAEGAGQTDACYMSLAAAVMALDLGMPVFTVRMHRGTAATALLVHDLSPLVPFLFLSGKRSEHQVEPVSVNIHGVRIAEWG